MPTGALTMLRIPANCAARDPSTTGFRAMLCTMSGLILFKVDPNLKIVTSSVIGFKPRRENSIFSVKRP